MGFNSFTKEPVRFIRIMMPERTIKGKRVGIIRSNQRFNPFKAKERQSAGKHKMIPVSKNEKSV